MAVNVCSSGLGYHILPPSLLDSLPADSPADNHISFLPERRYASAGNSDRNVSVRLSVCPSVCHAPVLCQNEESFFTIWQPQDSSFLTPNFITKRDSSNKGRSEKFSDILALSVNILKMVADTALSLIHIWRCRRSTHIARIARSSLR